LVKGIFDSIVILRTQLYWYWYW